MPKQETMKPRLKNIDDLFGADVTVHERGIESVTITDLQPFPNHPFTLYSGEKLDDMVESIKTNGILVPIIVRRVDGILQILAGHNRVCASKLADLTEVPAIILDNINDDVALVYVVETNVMQRGFGDMSHSEKAAVIALHHSKMFSQGKRNDILEHIKLLEKPSNVNENSTSAEFRRSSDTRSALASEYGLSPNQVALYRRANELSEPLRTRLDNNEFSLSVASDLSFLKGTEQRLVTECMELNSFKVDVKKADLLRQYSDKGKLNDESVYLVLSGEALSKPKPPRSPTVKIKSTVYEKYFKGDQSKKEIQVIVEKALDLYFAQIQDVDAIFNALPDAMTSGGKQ